MEEYLYEYLTQNYYIKTSGIGNDGIYKINDTRRIETPMNGDKLVTEIITIFGVEKEEVSLYVYKWASNIKHDIDLDYYWKVHWYVDVNADLYNDVVLPMLENINARSVSGDLEPIIPMEKPDSTLFYMDVPIEDSRAKSDRIDAVLETLKHFRKR